MEISYKFLEAQTTQKYKCGTSIRQDNAEVNQGRDASWIGASNRINILDHKEIGQERTERKRLPTEITVEAWDCLKKFIITLMGLVTLYTIYYMTGMTPEIMCYFIVGIKLTMEVKEPKVDKKRITHKGQPKWRK